MKNTLSRKKVGGETARVCPDDPGFTQDLALVQRNGYEFNVSYNVGIVKIEIATKSTRREREYCETAWAVSRSIG